MVPDSRFTGRRSFQGPLRSSPPPSYGGHLLGTRVVAAARPASHAEALSLPEAYGSWRVPPTPHVSQWGRVAQTSLAPGVKCRFRFSASHYLSTRVPKMALGLPDLQNVLQNWVQV